LKSEIRKPKRRRTLNKIRNISVMIVQTDRKKVLILEFNLVKRDRSTTSAAIIEVAKIMSSSPLIKEY